MGEKYHMVCRECPEEALGEDQKDLRERMRAHREETGHRVMVRSISAV